MIDRVCWAPGMDFYQSKSFALLLALLKVRDVVFALAHGQNQDCIWHDMYRGQTFQFFFYDVSMLEALWPNGMITKQLMFCYHECNHKDVV